MIYQEKTYPRVYDLGHEPTTPWVRFRLTLQRVTTQAWYQLLSLKAQDNLTFMNFGYSPESPGLNPLELESADEINRDTIQLYHRVASAVSLRGKDVLEVGSGRGGGAAFVRKYLQPRSMTGVDFCGRAVAFCKRRHTMDGLAYKRGDAEALPFPSGSFDAVVNVESCHCYRSVDRFLGEVSRVLRGNGNLLFADVGPQLYTDALRTQMERSGLSIVEEEDIGAGVVRALALNSVRHRASIHSEVPVGLRTVFSNFSGIEGTPVFEAIRSGEWKYVRYVLRKPA